MTAAAQARTGGPGPSPASADSADSAASAAPAEAAPLPVYALRRRLVAWFEGRLPVADRHVLTQRNLYIVPTSGGWAFGAMLLVLLVASINYQLSLGYVLTFLLAGSGLVSMHLTHGTLRGLTLHLRAGAPVFAGQPATLEIVIDNPGRARHGIGVGFRDEREAASLTWFDVPATGQALAHLRFVPGRRGWHGVPTLTVQTRFPFGLFHAWTVWRPAARVLAWPAPEHPAPPLPPGSPAPGDAAARQREEGGEFEGVRPWRRGDSLRQVVWKKMARTGDLVSRDGATPVSRELWLEWAAARVPPAQRAERPDDEARLSRLAAWTVAADREGSAYGLRLPGAEMPPSTGEGHRRAVLEALALWA